MNPQNVEFIQVCQGRNHLLMLDTAGRVYGYGENTYFQIYCEGNQGNVTATHLSNHSASEAATPSQRSQRLGSIAKGEIIQEKGAEFIDRVHEIQFGDIVSRSIYRVHAFNNTSVAVDRSGELFVWGENTLSDNPNPKPIKCPTTIKEFKKVKISKERRGA